MASDEIVWQYINQNFCAFKIRTPNNQKQTNFCRNEYNVTGLCNRQSCPLANSRYASVRPHPEKPNVLYLYMKTVERAHLPNRMWEKIRLPSNYQKALAMIDEKLMYWPEFLKHKAKQRLTRLTQVAIRMRKIAAEEERLGEKLVPKLAPKVKHREEARERKAEAAAKLERTIERAVTSPAAQVLLAVHAPTPTHACCTHSPCYWPCRIGSGSGPGATRWRLQAELDHAGR